MTRITSCFEASEPTAEIALAGLARFPFPCEFVSVNLIQVNIPFAFDLSAPSGFLLLSLDDNPNVLLVDGVRYPYTWCLNFEPSSLAGNFCWFSQAVAGDFFSTVRFTPTLKIRATFVTRAGPVAFPPTPADRFCSVEVSIKPKP